MLKILLRYLLLKMFWKKAILRKNSQYIADVNAVSPAPVLIWICCCSSTYTSISFLSAVLRSGWRISRWRGFEKGTSSQDLKYYLEISSSFVSIASFLAEERSLCLRCSLDAGDSHWAARLYWFYCYLSGSLAVAGWGSPKIDWLGTGIFFILYPLNYIFSRLKKVKNNINQFCLTQMPKFFYWSSPRHRS